MGNEEVLSIREEWSSFYGHAKPIAFSLRKNPTYTQHWLRIHSLPQSKRYAQNEDEMSAILELYNELGDSILGKNGECVVFFADNSSATFRNSLKKFDITFNTSITRLDSFDLEEFEDSLLTICGGRTCWQRGKFDSILRRIANDRIRYVSFFNNVSGEIFAPYDGGVDMFLSSDLRREQLKAKFSHWLSTHPEGL